jgi:hypothetical protein
LGGLVAWYPTGTLDEEERRRVESHVRQCATCDSLLRFGDGVRASLSLEHPAPDAIVTYSEDPGGLSRAEREKVERHLEECGECRMQVDLLEEVERSDTASPPSERPSFWRWFGANVLGPVPAAVYLVVVVVLAGLYVGSRDGIAPPLYTDAGVGVVIVADEGEQVRGAGAVERESVAVDATSPRLLLLELTRLDSPPAGDDVYEVTFTPAAPGAAAVSFAVEGRTFRDNYTIGYILRPGVLAPGRYGIEVRDPGGDSIFKSSLEIR